MSTPSSKIAADLPDLVTLIDVDDTLINCEGTSLNLALIEVLQEAGIRDIYLFTSMYNWQVRADLDLKGGLYSREHLIYELKNKYQFNVLKVITPGDVYTQIPGAYYTEKWKPVYVKWQTERSNTQNKQLKDEMQRDIRGIDADIHNAEAMLLEEHNRLKAEGKKEKAETFIRDNQQNKADMYRLVQTSIPARSYLYFDDKLSEIENVEKEHQGSKAQLTSIPVLQKSADSYGDLPGEEGSEQEYRKRKEQIKQRYRQGLIKHFSGLPNHKESVDNLVKNAQQYESACTSVKTLEEYITQMECAYKLLSGKLSKHKYSQNIEELVKQFESYLQSPMSMHDICEQVSQLIMQEYCRLKAFHEQKPSSFLSKKKSFLDRLNSEPKYHHYARILGLIINSQCLFLNQPDSYSAIMEEVAQINIPKNLLYRNFNTSNDAKSVSRTQQRL